MMIATSEKELSGLVQEAIAKHGIHRDALVPILTEINRVLGYIPAEAMAEVRRQVHVPGENLFISESQLYALASFYDMLSTKPRGRHVVKFCENAPCHVVGGRDVWNRLQETLHLKAGESSPDGKWSLVTTSCLGICSVGPVFLVDDDVYGNVTPNQVADILGRYE